MANTYCFGCGADIDEDARVCPKCGRSLEEVIPPPPPEVVYEAAPEPEEAAETPAKVNEALAAFEALADEKREQDTVPFNAKRFFAKKIIGLMFVISGLAGLEVFFGYIPIYIKRHREPPIVILTVALNILFMITVIIGNRIMKERKPVRGEVLVKQRSSNKRKTAGALILTPFALFFAYMFYVTIEEFGYTYLSADDLSEILTIDMMCLSYLWIGIKMFLPRTVIKEAPADGENTDMESEDIEK